MLNKRQKINNSIIFISLILIFGIFITEKYIFYPFINILIILSVNLLIVLFYELWQFLEVKLNLNERTTLIFISTFFRKNGFSNEEILDFVKPFVKAYDKKDVKGIIFSSDKTEYLKFYFSWNNTSNRMYILFIIMDIIYTWGIREKISDEDLRKVSKKIIFNSEIYRKFDKHFEDVNSSEYFNIYAQVWKAYKTIGVFPKRNNFTLKKVIEKREYLESESVLFKMISVINKENRFIDYYKYYEDKNFNVFKVIWIALSIISIPFGIIPLALFTFVFFVEILSELKIDVENSTVNLHVNSKLSDSCEILKVKLANDFYNSRYSVQKHKIAKYIQQNVENLTRNEINIILEEKQTLNEITNLINKSNCVSKNLLRTLFDIAAADNFFSNKEDEYIFMVGKLLEISKEDIIKIRNEYLKKGIREKKIQQNYHKKTYSKPSSSMYAFYYEKAYKILGLEKTASAEEIKKAYRALVMKNHPDKFAMQGKAAIDKAEEKFQIITEAYELIKRLKNIS